MIRMTTKSTLLRSNNSRYKELNIVELSVKHQTSYEIKKLNKECELM